MSPTNTSQSLFLLMQKQCPRGIQKGMGGRDIKTLEKLPKIEKK